MSINPEAQRFMLANFRDTTLTPLDVMKIGEGFLNLTASAQMLGWKSPASSLDYTADNPQQLMWARFPRDFVAWTSGRKSQALDCDERLRTFIVESGWTRHALGRVEDALTDGAA